MLHSPFYDPQKSYEENFKEGPYGAFTDGQVFKNSGGANFDFFGHKLFSPFGIPAGPLVNGKFIRAALDKGFDITVYKTVRSNKYPCNPWPNVVPVNVEGDLNLKQADTGVVVKETYTEPLTITNSFGVPSFNPDFWQKDLSASVNYAREGQIVVGSFQGTQRGDGDIKSYIQDFADTARLVKETGAKVLEVNLSCPNEGSAHLLCFDLERAKQVVEAIKNEIGNTPLIIKIAYFSDQEELVKLIKLIGNTVDGIAAINTMPAKILKPDGTQALPGNGRLVSGLCGSGIAWAGLEMVSRLKTLREDLDMKYTIVGVGGVMNADDYEKYRSVGADAVMSATGAMWNPLLAQEIKAISNK